MCVLKTRVCTRVQAGWNVFFSVLCGFLNKYPTPALWPLCGSGNSPSCHCGPQAWDGFQTCSPNWLILVTLKSCRTTKLWKSSSLNKTRCQVCSYSIRLNVSTKKKKKKIPSPQPPPPRDSWRRGEVVDIISVLRVITSVLAPGPSPATTRTWHSPRFVSCWQN